MKELCITIPCEPTKPWTDSDVRPLYIFLGNDSTGAARTTYVCPFCELEMATGKACQKHMGMVMNVPPGCRVLRKINSDREVFVRSNFAKVKKEIEDGYARKTDERCAVGRSGLQTESGSEGRSDIYLGRPRPVQSANDSLLDFGEHRNMPGREIAQRTRQSAANESATEPEASRLSDELWMLREREKINRQAGRAPGSA